jgi:hypothetical protein
MRNQGICGVLVLLLAVAGCASHDQYRYTKPPIPAIDVSDLENRKPVDNGKGGTECSEKLFRDRSIEKFKAANGEVFTIGIIELSDDGHVKDVGQRDEVFRELKRVARGGDTVSASSPGAVLVTFVHGWHHKAKVCDENLSCYRQVMKGLVERKADRANKGPVFGIYIGWRGDSLHKADALSFYNRKNAAQHVGALGGRDLLLEIGQTHKALDREVRTATGGQRFVNAVTVGHSFGGALVYSAVEALEVSEYLVKNDKTDGPKYKNEHGVGYPSCNGAPKPVRAGIGDLVILVNPAFEAYRYRQFAHDLAATGSYSSEQRPVLLTVASTADDAVGKAFPAGRFLWLLWHPAAWSDGGAQITGLGHYAPYTTHELVYEGPPEKPVEPPKLTDAKAVADCGIDEEIKEGLARGNCGCSYNVYSNPPPTTAPNAGHSDTPSALAQGEGSVHSLHENFNVTLKPLSSSLDRHAPFIVASAPGNLISGHNDIYNPNFVLFLIGFINNTMPGPGEPKPPQDVAPCI